MRPSGYLDRRLPQKLSGFTPIPSPRDSHRRRGPVAKTKGLWPITLHMSMQQTQVRRQKKILWGAAAATALAAVFFPHLEAVKNKDQPLWELWPHDREGLVLVPLIIVLTIALFALLGGWAWSGAGNRPAKVGLVCGILGLVGVLAFFLSAPI